MSPPIMPVAITGFGVVSPVGVGRHAYHAAQLAAQSGVDAIGGYDPGTDRVRIAGEVTLPPELEVDRQERLRTDRCTRLASAAARLAVEDAGLDLRGEGVDLRRTGVVMGSGMGGAGTWEAGFLRFDRGGIEAVRARTIPMGMVNGAAAWIAIHYGLTGPCTTVCTACAAGSDALVAAHQMIAAGEADVVLSGGAEAPVIRAVVAAFTRLTALSERNDEPQGASRPFAKDRDGFVIAEGAAVLVLESPAHAAARGATELARLVGYGRSSDAHHVTMPHPEGTGGRAAIEAALRSAGAAPTDVRFVNAHGTGTVHNDAVEARALHAVFGPGAVPPVMATKSITGHALGAAGAMEAVATVQALTAGLVPPTANQDEPDTELDLDVVAGEPRPVATGLALSNSFAFGGHNVVLAFEGATGGTGQ